MECYNPKGEICPGQMAAVEWKFSPLEARTYTVDTNFSSFYIKNYIYEYIFIYMNIYIEQLCVYIHYVYGMETEFNCHCMVARSNVSSLIRAGLVRKDIQPLKTHSNILMDRQLPDGD